MISSLRIITSFLKKEARDFSCVLCPLPWKIAEEIRQWGLNNISDEDLIGDGRESSIHVTLKYGLHNHDPFELRPLLQNYGPIEITLGKFSIFENGKEDVVKISVRSPRLVKLNSIITNQFENTETHPEYIPHITICYVKPELGKKYDGNTTFEGRKVILDKAEFSGNDYRETTFSMVN
jgi:2'-5' RNA ligase